MVIMAYYQASGVEHWIYAVASASYFCPLVGSTPGATYLLWGLGHKTPHESPVEGNNPTGDLVLKCTINVPRD